MIKIHKNKNFRRPPIPTSKPKQIYFLTDKTLSSFETETIAQPISKQILPQLTCLNLTQTILSCYSKPLQQSNKLTSLSISKTKPTSHSQYFAKLSSRNQKQISLKPNNRSINTYTNSQETTHSSNKRFHLNNNSRSPTPNIKTFRSCKSNISSRNNSTDKTNINVIQLNNEYIQTHNLFKLKGQETRFAEYGKKEKKYIETRENKPCELIYTKMSRNFKDRKINYKTINDIKMTSEIIETKKMIRFWKAVFDVSYPRIMLKKIKQSTASSSKDRKNMLYEIRKQNKINRDAIKYNKFHFSRNNN